MSSRSLVDFMGEFIRQAGSFFTPLVIRKLESTLVDEELSGLAENPRAAKDVLCNRKDLVREGAIDEGGEGIVLFALLSTVPKPI